MKQQLLGILGGLCLLFVMSSVQASETRSGERELMRMSDRVMVAQGNWSKYKKRQYRNNHRSDHRSKPKPKRRWFWESDDDEQPRVRARQYQRDYRYNAQRRSGRNNNGWYTDSSQRNQRSQARQEVEVTYSPRQNDNVKYSAKLCESGEYECITVKRGQTWKKLFPDAKQRDIVRRLNRTNLRLRRGEQIAVPHDLDKISMIDVAPFEHKIDTKDEKLILVSLPKQAWAAYNKGGELLHWGPVSGGRNWCPDIHKPCNTIQGVFNVFGKKGAGCRSESFPVNRGGGSPMPYCMFFHSGFALHGSYEVPGYNASHGCVRMYKEDAKWLNHEFVDLPASDNDKGTRVIVHVFDEPSVETYAEVEDEHLDEGTSADIDFSDDYFDL